MRLRRSVRSPPSRDSAATRPTAAALLLAVAAAAPAAAGAQDEPDRYTLRVPGGPSLSLTADSVEDMLRRTRRLGTILEEDPDVLYYVGTGGDVDVSEPSPAYPWNAVRPESDSTARVRVPANYREARRAYYAYAVRIMEAIRGSPPSTRCGASVRREVDAVSAFVDGWIVTRTLFGGPAFPPLDALVFARDAGHLQAALVELGGSRLGGCARRWARQNPEAVEAYRAWREDFRDGSGADARAGSGADPGAGDG
jgi:hypothetical protein